MKTCLYCGLEKPDDAFSDEHIWPDALGGDHLPPLWRTNDVCVNCNSMSGVFVDGSFIKSLMGAAERSTGARDYLSPNRPDVGVLPLDYIGPLPDVTTREGEMAEYWRGPCGANTDGYSGVNASAIARYGTAPVLAPEPAAPFHEEMVSQAAVMREWNRTAQHWDWYRYYSYRGQDGTLPGIRLATSPDGKKWTRRFNTDDPRGMGQIFRSTPAVYYEWHQVFKVGATYVLCIEVGVDHGARWRPGLAISTDPVQGWTQLDLDTMLQTKWSGLYDDRTLYHVATPALYLIDGKWYLFAQACGRPANDNYIDGAWEMCGVVCDRAIPTRPGCAGLYIPGVAAVVGKESMSE